VRRVTDRAPSRIALAPLQLRHWRALHGIATTVDRPLDALLRYLRNRGSYPWDVRLSTPTGAVTVRLENRHDLLTVVEVFCRRDYGSDAPASVLDIGANVGLAALYWLTRRPDSRVVCVEPDPSNAATLRRNLAGFEARYTLVEAAVTPGGADHVRFAPGGRYGRIDAAGTVIVNAVSVRELLQNHPAELVKIDTEGSERELVDAIPASFSSRIVWEDDGRVRRRRF
jgi:FkbM family methyltransferase